MKRYRPNESKDFRCKRCRKEVAGQAIGTKQRNHCPYCLCSLHVDEKIGDRASKCKRIMEPIGLTTKKDGEVMIVTKCIGCGKISTNRIAGDDNTDVILSLISKDVDMGTRVDLRKCNIELVSDPEEVKVQLFGKRPN